jgi:hypothetical protein
MGNDSFIGIYSDMLPACQIVYFEGFMLHILGIEVGLVSVIHCLRNILPILA